MDGGASIVLVIGSLVTWVALFLGVRKLLRNARGQEESLGHIAEAQTREGFHFELNRLTQTTGTSNNRQVVEYVEYTVRLPGPFADLSIADAEARRARGLLAPRVDIPVVAAPETDDDAFDGIFDYTLLPGPAIRSAMQDPAARQMLLNLRKIFDRGVWVDHGMLRVVELGRPGIDDIDITLEFLTGELVQLRERFGGAGPSGETVLGVGSTDDESFDEPETADARTGGDWM